MSKAICVAVAACLGLGSTGLSHAQSAVCPSKAIKWGVNNKYAYTDTEEAVSWYVWSKLRTSRVDVWPWDANNVAQVKRVLAMMQDRGIKAQVVVHSPNEPAYIKDHPCDASVDLQALTAQNQAYARTAGVELSAYSTDFELGNEWFIQLEGASPDRSKTPYTALYDTTCGRYYGAVLKGMSQGIAQAATDTGKPLRRILGTASNSWGYINFMTQQGVVWDVLGYHFYPRYSVNNTPINWGGYGAGGLFGGLAQWGKPVTINEFNCGEIYDGMVYSDQDTKTAACYNSIVKNAKQIFQQTTASIESLIFYEMVDNTGSAKVAERHFGLMSTMGSPKVSYWLAASMAGGTLTPDAQADLLNRQLLTSSEMSTWHTCGQQ